MISVSTDIQVSNWIKPGLLCHSVLLNTAVVAQVLSQWFFSIRGDRPCLWLCGPHLSTIDKLNLESLLVFQLLRQKSNSWIALGLGCSIPVASDPAAGCSQTDWHFARDSNETEISHHSNLCVRVSWKLSSVKQNGCLFTVSVGQKFLSCSRIFFLLDIGRNWRPGHVSVPFSHVTAIDE